MLGLSSRWISTVEIRQKYEDLQKKITCSKEFEMDLIKEENVPSKKDKTKGIMEKYQSREGGYSRSKARTI